MRWTRCRSPSAIAPPLENPPDSTGWSHIGQSLTACRLSNYLRSPHPKTAVERTSAPRRFWRADREAEAFQEPDRFDVRSRHMVFQVMAKLPHPGDLLFPLTHCNLRGDRREHRRS